MENKTVLNIILVSLLLLYLSAFTFVMVAYVAPMVGRRRGASRDNEPLLPPVPIQPPIFRQPIGQCTPISDFNSSQQTDFFNQSVIYAEQYLYSDSKLDGYKYGSEIDLSRLNDKAKQQIKLSLRALTENSVSARDMEQKIRSISEAENVPLWMVVLHEASKRIVPFR